ncbi:hypothetical protein H109_04817 [Trichophyton interdigitale MR816]|uniref:Trafficking protein particle complex subunit n=1 Tax=Trichophyton interdigitale (strain MR816) TaxID=1215338 RepID=A0A059J5Z6_TRIIM|nr:hypothetical protein H109_04817 [Trichophyton interdigitale MR816]
MTSTLPNPGLPKTGLEVLETERFRLTCFQTVTGTKFLLFTDPLMPNVDSVIAKIYELYADYVMKNPFYQLEMPASSDVAEGKIASKVLTQRTAVNIDSTQGASFLLKIRINE